MKLSVDNVPSLRLGAGRECRLKSGTETQMLESCTSTFICSTNIKHTLLFVGCPARLWEYHDQ